MKFVSLFVILLAAIAAPADAARDERRLTHPAVVNELVIPYPVFAIYVLPGEAIRAGFLDSVDGADYSFRGKRGDLAGAALRAPDKAGHEVLELRNRANGEISRINVFTMVPASRVDGSGRLNGYRIGAYPTEPLRGLEIYEPPAGFVQVTRANADVRISPNFTLGQFLAKQESGFPKYLVLRAELLLKLENILATLNAEGHAVEGFTIMSGYRTPFYNRAIGNVQYSRHVWGGAADFYIDENPADGVMDDMNGDGKLNREDARWLAAFINRMSMRGDFGPRVGGIGVYGSNSAHGPFVHVDVRGSRARW